jgi:hypothetical protein
LSSPGPEEQDTLLWNAAECRYAIEIPRSLLEELNGRALEGFRRLSRGGIEVGGILFGRRMENRIRILAWREAACEHSRGPGFILSNADRQLLVQQLEAAEADPQLQVLEPLGMFVSHTKSEVSLTEEDLEIFDRFFPEHWQVALVLHPVKSAHTHAGFFVREKDGMVQRERSYREFVIEGVREPKMEQVPAAEAPGTADAKANIETRAAVPPPLRHPAAKPRSSNRLAIAAAVLAVILVALIGVPSMAPSPDRGGAQAVNLRLLDDHGQLQIEWDRNSPVVRGADEAILEITDGGKIAPVRLDGEAIRGGKILYARLSSDVTVRLTLQQRGKEIWKELARSFGAPVAQKESRELQLIRENRAKLEEEATSLREKITREGERTRELEREVRKLSEPAQRRKR